MTEQNLVGRYQIQNYLGNGTYAVVYRAQDTLLKRVVALKVLKPIWARDREVSARFLREAQAAANLIHPNIAWVYDMGEAEGRHYIAARFVDGEPLDKVLAARGPMSWEAALQIVEDIGSGLDYAHSQGIVHRDVKPQNILISAAEGAVLTDFGLTRALDDSQRLTQAGAIVGTPQYIPPEVWNGEIAGPPADQYALACIFYEMLTGQILFEGQVIETIIRGHLNTSQVLDHRLDGLPSGALKLMGKALAPNPDDRFASLGNFTAALRQLTAAGLVPGETTLAGEPPAPPGEQQADFPGQALDPDQPPSESSTLGMPRSSSSKTGGLEAAGEWRERLEKVYRRINPVNTGRLRRSGSYKLLFQLVPAGSSAASRKTNGTGEQPEVLLIDRDKIVIGRSSASDVVVDFPDVSRQHASLIVSGQGVLLKDLRSTNGTFLNGERVIAEMLLENGDEIRLGSSVRFIFQEDE
jgi:serine/threonine protein kinase